MSFAGTKMGSFLGVVNVPLLPNSLMFHQCEVACDVADLYDWVLRRSIAV